MSRRAYKCNVPKRSGKYMSSENTPSRSVGEWRSAPVLAKLGQDRSEARGGAGRLLENGHQ
jgi:hypothetical protein